MSTVLEEIQKAEEMAIRTRQQAEQLAQDMANLRQKLGLDSSPTLFSAGSGKGVSDVKPARAKRNGNGSRRRRGRQAASGERAQQFLDAVRSKPGVTVAEIAAEFGVNATGLYRYARKYEKDGLIRKDGKQLFPVVNTDSPGTPLTPAPEEIPAA